MCQTRNSPNSQNQFSSSLFRQAGSKLCPFIQHVLYETATLRWWVHDPIAFFASSKFQKALETTQSITVASFVTNFFIICMYWHKALGNETQLLHKIAELYGKGAWDLPLTIWSSMSLQLHGYTGISQVFNYLLAIVCLLEYHPLATMGQQTKLLPIFVL